MSETHSPENTAVFGFWLYIMTDCVLFASLFATYAVLHNSIYGGVSSRDIFDLSPVLLETLILLTSSFTCGLAILAAHRNDPNKVMAWFAVTLILGLSFLSIELNEFHHLILNGHSWQASAFLSSFFTLVGTHGLHISIGSLWMVVAILHIKKHGLSPATIKNITNLSLFWHFLDIVWIFIFTIVYLMGVK